MQQVLPAVRMTRWEGGQTDRQRSAELLTPHSGLETGNLFSQAASPGMRCVFTVLRVSGRPTQRREGFSASPRAHSSQAASVHPPRGSARARP